MTLEKQIEFLKEWQERAERSLPILSPEDIDRLLRWLEDYKHLKSESRWIPCSERMPDEPGIHVMVTDGLHIMESWYEIIDGEMLWVDNYTLDVDINFGEVTHWRPITELPKK